MAEAARDSKRIRPASSPRKPPLYATPLGYTNRRPDDYPAIDRATLMRDAHRIARDFRPHYDSHRQALAYGLCAAWGQVKVAREITSLRAQVARVEHSAAELKASRAATRRTGSSLWAS